MSYPFERSCTIPHETSVKLKILATAEGIPITKMVVQVVDQYYMLTNVDKINSAKLKLQNKERDSK